MANPIRQRIRDHLVQVLTDRSSAVHVSVLSDEPAEVRHKFPSIVVHPVDDVEVRDGSVGFATRKASFALECWTRESDGVELADAVEEFLAEVIRVLCLDTSRGGNSFDTTIGTATFLLIVREQRLAGFELVVSSTYRYRFGAPDVAA